MFAGRRWPRWRLAGQEAHPQDGPVYADPAETMPVSAPCCPCRNGLVADVAYSFAMLGPSFLHNPWPQMKPVGELPAEVLAAIGECEGVIVAVVSAERGAADVLRRRFADPGVMMAGAGQLVPKPGSELPSIHLMGVDGGERSGM